MSNGDSAVLKALEQCRARLRDESFRMAEVSHSFLSSKVMEVSIVYSLGAVESA